MGWDKCGSEFLGQLGKARADIQKVRDGPEMEGLPSQRTP